jgi:hypothetical protein
VCLSVCDRSVIAAGKALPFEIKGLSAELGPAIELQARGGAELHGVAEFLADLNAEN